MQRFSAWAQRFMYGRYGYDQYSMFITFVSFVLMIAGLTSKKMAFYYISMAGYIYSMYRTYSRNITKRSAECNRYVRVKYRVISYFRFRKNRWKERKTHRYFRCPDCKIWLRVPKGNGRIRIHCSGCGKVIEKKT